MKNHAAIQRLCRARRTVEARSRFGFGQVDYYDRHRKPIDLWEWAELRGQLDYAFLKFTYFGGVTTKVITIWEGLDPCPDLFLFTKIARPPAIFETAIINSMVYGSFAWLQRAITEDAAFRTHERACDLVRAELAWLNGETNELPEGLR